VTSGIVSALARSGLGLGQYEDYIQTDASINPGNSGGALVNLRGELVGINTAIFSRSGGNIGIGFAIPANNVKRVTEQLVRYGKVKHGFLGGMFQDLTPDLAQAFGVAQNEGAVAVAVSPGSPAEKAGLQPGDVIVTIDGKRVNGAEELRNQIGLMRAGDKVALEVLRSGRRRQIDVTIEARADNRGGPLQNRRLAGATFGDIPEDSPAYGSVSGVLITNVEHGSRAWTNGLRPGDIVFSVNRVPVDGMAAFLRLVKGNDRPLVLGVRRGNSAAFLVVK
jgi:serine protease Do/serine protease DegQ